MIISKDTVQWAIERNRRSYALWNLIIVLCRLDIAKARILRDDDVECYIDKYSITKQ